MEDETCHATDSRETAAPSLAKRALRGAGQALLMLVLFWVSWCIFSVICLFTMLAIGKITSAGMQGVMQQIVGPAVPIDIGLSSLAFACIPAVHPAAIIAGLVASLPFRRLGLLRLLVPVIGLVCFHMGAEAASSLFIDTLHDGSDTLASADRWAAGIWAFQGISTWFAIPGGIAGAALGMMLRPARRSVSNGDGE